MTGSQERYQQAMSQGHSAAWDQLWDRAIDSYRQALAEFPDNPKALTSLGLALIEAQQFDEALTCYQRAAGLLPSDPMPLEKVGQICERTGKLSDAIQAFLQAADLNLKNHDVERAIENWQRITRFNAEHLVAHSRLAVTYERLGRKPQSVQEYLAVASIVQRSGAPDKALQAINYALQIMPDNPDANQALAVLRANQLLPRPVRARGGTGALRLPQMNQAAEIEKIKPEQGNQDPVSETRQKALIVLADILFESGEDSAQRNASRRAPGSILRGSPEPNTDQSQQATAMRHLGQAIDGLTQENEIVAALELEKAVDAGFSDPAAYFILGLLNVKQERPEMALRDLQTALRHPDFTLGSRLLLGETLRKMGRRPEAAANYLGALQIADAETAPEEQADTVYQFYEPLIEAQAQEKDVQAQDALCDNIAALLLRPDWHAHLLDSRAKMPPQTDGAPPLLLAEMLLQTRSNEVVESLASVRHLTEQNLLRTAMEEAYTALIYAPTYLPLHVQIGEILLKEERVPDAIDKLSVVAHAYSVRGDANQACALLRRLVQLAPLDLSVRTRLIEQLVASGQNDEAIRGYMDLADIYYHQADLTTARGVYASALRLAQSSPGNRPWIADILNRVADIDLQRLDLRQALRSYEQVRVLLPDDPKVRSNLIALNYRMSQESAAFTEMETFVTYLQGKGRGEQAAQFLRGLVEEHPELSDLTKRVASARLHA